MRRKTAIAIVILLLIGGVVSAKGAAEVITGALVGATLFLINPVAGAIGLVAGATAGGLKAGANIMQEGAEENAQALNEYYSALNTYNEMDKATQDLETMMMQSESEISAFDQALARYQQQYDIQLTQLQAEGQGQYQALMQNWQGTELAQSAKGQVGGSAALVAQQARSQLTSFVGQDLTLDTLGGTFGTALSELRLDSIAGRLELIKNREVAAEGYQIYGDALAKYRQQLGIAESTLNTKRRKASDRGLL